jgi:hypothetical protein
MKSKNISHSKVKNTGILFEMVVRQVTVDAMNGNTDSPALRLMRKYFNVNTELGKELQFYHAFSLPGQLSETKAIHYIDLILNRRKKLDEKKLAREKYELVKEIKEHYDLNEFLSCRIPNYKILASIYKSFMAETANANIANIQEVAMSKFALIEHLSSSKAAKQRSENPLFEQLKGQPEDLRLLTYKVLLEKFNEKYAGLNDDQKQLLREYINSISNSNSLQNYIRTRIPTVKQSLLNLSKSHKDKVLQIKLTEVANLLDKVAVSKTVKENEVTAMIIAYQILKELQ